MKKISYLLMAFVFAASACFTACEKDETENENATLDDFVGTYDVSIKTISSISEVIMGGETYNDVTMTLNAISAATIEQQVRTSSELLDVAAKSYLDSIDWNSERLAQFSFKSANDSIGQNGWYSMLNSTYGYVKGGYIYMASSDINGEYVLIFTQGMPWKESGTATWKAYYLEQAFVKNLIEENVDEGFDYTKFDWASVLTGDVNYTELTFTATRK
ncbi:MAG: hypothetical protein IJ764_01470 [Bacteroidales bacterium]|nr:hypothetical protein [Bacteroidales bacterium]